MERISNKKYQEMLERLKSEYSELLKSVDDKLHDPMADNLSELSLYDNHPADIASEVYERGKEMGLRNYVLQQLAKVENALEKLANGKYGYCDKCGQPISRERLETIPLTTMCVNCREQEGINGDNSSRPVEEELINFSFISSEKENGAKEREGSLANSEFDGEDSWQSVASFGTSNSPSDIGSVSNYDCTYYDSDEGIGYIERYENIPVYKDKDGQFYQDFELAIDEGGIPDSYKED